MIFCASITVEAGVLGPAALPRSAWWGGELLLLQSRGGWAVSRGSKGRGYSEKQVFTHTPRYSQRCVETN